MGKDKKKKKIYERNPAEKLLFNEFKGQLIERYEKYLQNESSRLVIREPWIFVQNGQKESTPMLIGRLYELYLNAWEDKTIKNPFKSIGKQFVPLMEYSLQNLSFRPVGKAPDLDQVILPEEEKEEDYDR